MDRNIDTQHFCICIIVALRKESVDRNGYFGCQGRYWVVVALRKESVDRNPPVDTSSVSESEVALRKESVDRNCRITAEK